MIYMPTWLCAGTTRVTSGSKKTLVCLTSFLNNALSVNLGQLDPIDHTDPGIENLL